MVSELQKRAAQAIVNVFETGRPQGDYGNVTYHPKDPGELTYGRSQTTLAGGNLYLLIRDYCAAPDGVYGPQLAPYLDRLAKKDSSLNFDDRLKSLLREAGRDPVMRECQDRFFDRVYWEPSLASARNIGVETALGVSVVYDSRIHGSWPRIRDLTTAELGSPAQVGEKVWVEGYVARRRNWLANHANTLLRQTVYRMDSFRGLIGENKWGLELPLTVRGVRIDESVLLGAPLRVSAEDRQAVGILRLETPAQRGEDVRRVQEALVRAGCAVTVDGVFGPETDRAVRAFQAAHGGLKVDGIVGPATRTALAIEN